MGLRTRTVDSIDQVGAQQWAQLENSGNPFLNWHFLHALESSGSVAPANGWQPHHLCVYEDDQLVAAAPSYIKTDSRGEFVFDWAWADGHHRIGLPYYPKLLTAVPWTPVCGPRLLVARNHPDPGRLRHTLVNAAISHCIDKEMSSWHCNFITDEDRESLSGQGLLLRQDIQFHWHNRGYSDFDEFLSRLKSKKRKNIRHERKQVASAGIRFLRKTGAELDGNDIHFLHRCYRRTFHAHGNHPALTTECFDHFVKNMPGHVLAVLAYRDDQRLAMSLYMTSGEALYGRYWGTVEDVPGLHFETAYYQGIEYCIEHGLKRFESGAQGEHKIARGFEPVNTYSSHFILHEGFRSAIEDYLEHEANWLRGYRGEIARHEPFRHQILS